MAVVDIISSPIHSIWDDFTAARGRTREAYRSDPAVARFATGLLVANLTIIGLSVAIKLLAMDGLISQETSDLMNFARDRSLPEYFNYLQSGMCAVFLFLTWHRCRSLVFLAWAAMFTFILLDDSLEYHETFGAWLVGAFGLHGVDGLRAADSGEILAWVLAAAVLVPLTIAAALRARWLERGFAILMGLAFAALVFCGVGLDMLHVLLGSRVITLLEDGGEMLAIAAACILAFSWYRSYGRVPAVYGVFHREAPN